MSMTPPYEHTLYDPANEHDACGVAFVVDIHGRRSRGIVDKALTALANLEHRGAAGAEETSGDGAGILVQVPDALLRAEVGFALPPAGAYATGIAFLPTAAADADRAAEHIASIAADEGGSVLGWREVPVEPHGLGTMARSSMPAFRQVFLSFTDAYGAALTGMDLERRAYVVRKRIEREISGAGTGEVYFASLSGRTLVYKGMLTTPQLPEFFTDLRDERMVSALGLVHSRFSTNTLPSWPLAHPFRTVAHNGEINTVIGNENWMRAREALIDTSVFTRPGSDGPAPDIFPTCTPGASDTARFDEVLELLHLGGRSLPHAVLMMIPEAWQRHETMDPARRAFYEYNAALMEPWDGPASVAFTDGTLVGAVLDRNGLRPSRIQVTDDGLVVMASEAGVLDLEPERIVRRLRLQPGRMFLVDTAAGRIIDDEEIKSALAAELPYGDWVARNVAHLSDLPDHPYKYMPHERVVLRHQVFGYTEEEVTRLIRPMAATGAEAIGSMGTDTPLAVLSDRPRILFDYFAQLFAQVTNPPLDAIREKLVTSLATAIGPEGDLLHPAPESTRRIVLADPILDNDEFTKLVHVNDEGAFPDFRSAVVRGLYRVAEGGDGLRRALEDVRRQVSEAIAAGIGIVVLSDRESDEHFAPIPSLLLTAAVHHHLVRERTRTRVGLVIESGDAREVHHMAMLIGYGASAINPYMAFEAIDELFQRGDLAGLMRSEAVGNYVHAAGKGVLKVMSKMGISTIASYTGAQLFDAVGLSAELVDEYFPGTSSRIGGIGLDQIADDVARRHGLAFTDRATERAHRELEVGGDYQWRREGEYHLFNPDTVFLLQHATRTGQYRVFQEYTRKVDDQSQRLATLRGLLRLRTDAREPVPLEEVEPVSAIVRRFSTGAMSFGSISAEAHETLAIAMNRLKARSNSGEGGEDTARFDREANGDWRRSAIKQVASGRFGVTSHYLANCTDIQIKMAQGAKPGEGGQLPGNKVYPWIAEVRHSTPGVGLISPPPHHDIYSIEDLAQLIHDLKCANPKARIHVKLVAQLGVGTVAAGVSKAHADVVLISGHDGGTGAAPLTSLKHAGGPWELGLAETQQTLLRSGLRDRISVQCDGQLKTGRDVMIAALLGAEEFGFATAPLVVSGCVMMRVCHLDTCPVGVATQNPALRERFTGSPEFVVNFFEYIAEEVRELMARLGFRTLDEAIGQVGMLDTAAAVEHFGPLDHYKAGNLDLAPVLAPIRGTTAGALYPDQDLRCTKEQDHGLAEALDHTLIARARGAIDGGGPVRISLPIGNVDRSVGAMLGYEISTAHGADGLPDGTIEIAFTGSAGNSFGAFVPRGVTMRLAGEANDYVGKGLSGGRLVLRPPERSHPDFRAEDNVIAGNVVLYGATGGEMFVRGTAGERFAVRNSGAVAVVEGIGDHGCEYMTGGRVVVLGPTGRNFAAGMSGGEAYVHDPHGALAGDLNAEMVDLEPVEPGSPDAQWLHTIISRHALETSSVVAESILDGWPHELASFRKAMPRDFKRVLQAKQQAHDDGTNVNDAIMAVTNG